MRGMKLKTIVRLLVPAGALTALILVPITSPAKPVLGLEKAPLAASISPVSPPPTGTLTDRVVAVNDIHGYLQAGTAGVLYGVAAGGIRQLTNELEQLEAGATTTNGKPNVSFVGAGDMVGASPLVSALFDDEPTLDILHDLDLDYTSVGNHEFDRGLAELKRQQDGGCGLTTAEGASASQVSQQCTFSYSDDMGSQAAGSYAGLGRDDPSDTPSQPYDDAGVTTGYLAANVVPNPGGPTAAGVTEPVSASNPASYSAPIFPAYGVKTFPNGTKVGYIGVVLAGTPGIVTAAGVQGLAFLDEATVANYYAAKLQAQGVNTIVLLIHQGGAQSGSGTTVDSCSGFTGAIQPILNNLSSAISVVLSAHTHQAYDCAISTPTGTKLVTSAAKYSEALTEVDLTVTPYTGDATGDQLISANAKNVLINTTALTEETSGGTDSCTPTSVPTASTSDPLYYHVRNIECAAVAESATKANQVEGNITADIKRSVEGPSGNYDGFGETQMGDVIADAQLTDAQANNPSVVAAFMNEGGVRNDLLYNPSNNPVQPGQVTYGEDFQVQPFGDYLVTMQLTGAQILTVLEEQFEKCNSAQYADEYLPLSGLTYTVNFAATSCASLITNARVGVPAGSDSTTAGSPLDPNATYTIEANNYLAGGGDSFPGFEAGQNMTYGDVDVDALNDYLQDHNVSNGDQALTPPTPDRVSVVGGSPATFNPSAPSGLPETPFVIALPVTGLAAVGGVLYLRRRRRPAAAV
jgi:5'-nucleotidase